LTESNRSLTVAAQVGLRLGLMERSETAHTELLRAYSVIEHDCS
jgi:hypothetical protein